MGNRKRLYSGILASTTMLVIILDSKTALYSAQEGLALCIRSVIPSLFPFFILSGIISSSLIGQNNKIFRYFGKLCKVPKGAESLLAVGLLSGYPVGAQLVSQAYQEGKLTRDAARRLLGFCSNAGPAFIFGILTPLFEKPYVPWILWCVHIAGALAAGWLLPGSEGNKGTIKADNPIALTEALRKAIINIATVCGWVVVFRIILGFCNRWFLWLLSTELQVLLSGIMELSNGCLMLENIPSEGARFLLAGFMLSFGGLCVLMQTRSVTMELGLGCYFPGKVAQTSVTLLCCYLLRPVLFPKEQSMNISVPWFIATICITALIAILIRKKVVAFGGRMLYNTDS